LFEVIGIFSPLTLKKGFSRADKDITRKNSKSMNLIKVTSSAYI